MIWFSSAHFMRILNRDLALFSILGAYTFLKTDSVMRPETAKDRGFSVDLKLTFHFFRFVDASCASQLTWLVLILTETYDFAHYYFPIISFEIFLKFLTKICQMAAGITRITELTFIPFDSQARRWTVTQQFHEFLSLLSEELTHFSFRLILRRFMRIPTDPFWLFPTDSDWDERVRTLLSSKDDIFISRGHRSLR